jgi:hypothetical protein
MPPKKGTPKKITVASTFVNDRYVKAPTNRASMLDFIDKHGTDKQKDDAGKHKKDTANLQRIFKEVRKDTDRSTYDNWISTLEVKALRAGTAKTKAGEIEQTPVVPEEPPKGVKGKEPAKEKGEGLDPAQSDQREAEVETAEKPAQMSPFDRVDEDKTNEGVVGLFPKLKQEHPKSGGDPINNFYTERTGIVNAFKYRRDKMYPFMRNVRIQQQAMGIRRQTPVTEHTKDPAVFPLDPMSFEKKGASTPAPAPASAPAPSATSLPFQVTERSVAPASASVVPSPAPST